MNKALVLAEKPSVARALASVLGCSQKVDGAFIGEKYIVTWALGHLVTLVTPEQLDERYKTWKMDDLPIIPRNIDLTVIKETSRQYHIVKSHLSNDRIDRVIIATDAGREGELVARWILEKSGVRKPLYRLWVSSQTDKAILDGFNNLQPGEKYYNLYQSAVCRAKADWLVGFNASRALTCKYNAQLSAGRVQTPTLNMVVEKEKSIKSFQPIPYYTIQAVVNGIPFIWYDKNNKSRIFDKAESDRIIERLKGKKAVVDTVDKVAKTQHPPQLYSLTDLQIDANNMYGMSAKKTLNIMQKLYEEYKVVTYPRTDSRHLTSDIVGTLNERLDALLKGPYRETVLSLKRAGLTVSKRTVDDTKVGDHHAIFPTEQHADLSEFSADESKIYHLIVKRFLSAFSMDYKYEKTTVHLKIEGETFSAGWNTPVYEGWKKVYESSDVKNSRKVNFVKGEEAVVSSINAQKELTSPPKRYTEATLLADMENPAKFVQNKELGKTLTETGGIGTVATRADILEKLFESGYLDKRGNEIIPTSKGFQLINLVPEDLKSPVLTGEWEQKLTAVSRGNLQANKFLKSIEDYTNDIIGQIKNDEREYKHDNMTTSKCPECGHFLLRIKNKNGERLACSNPECRYTKSLSVVSNARCPECHKKLILMGEGDSKYFFCESCRYKEDLKSWNKRKEESAGVMKKSEVKRYINKQQETLTNNPFAEALKNLDKGKK